MENPVAEQAPYFNPDHLRDELTALWKEHQHEDHKLRSLVLGKLNELKKHAHDQAEKALMATGDGRACAEGLSLFQDELISVIYDYTTSYIYRASNPTAAERISIVATGGYGRGALAPGSDIDLLFLLPYKQTAWGESVIEYMLYLLWDMGFKVGHATRSLEQTIRFAKTDITTRTALLDSRYLWGERSLFDDFIRAFGNEVVRGTAREFIEAKLEERDDRHKASGSSRYMVEPNVKDGKGGQRDLHTLHWISKYLCYETHDVDLANFGFFTKEEAATFKHCDDFLWTVRCHLHFLTNRPEERITFDLQKHMAERLGYAKREGMQAVERFMKHYFLIATEVGNLTRVLCADLEMKQLKSTPKLNQFLEQLGWRQRAALRKSSDFRIENGRINIIHKDTFKRDPVNLIRIFTIANRYNTMLHPSALREMRRSLRLIDQNLRENRRANEHFLELLTSKNDPEKTLRNMSESGVLGRFIPEFGQINSMMQFNMYHHFTVDEHLIRTIGELSWIDRGEAGEALPLSHDVIHTVKNRRALYVAAFIHDIAKGRPEDHSIAGAEVARELCPRLGLNGAETDTVAWLIEEHLTMSQYAQSRDLNDPQTIKDFAKIVQSRERLKLLVILTVCDIRAVGPGTWNGWKGQLLRTLYSQTDILLSGGLSAGSHRARIDMAISKFRDAMEQWSDEKVETYQQRHFPAYWLKTDLETQIAHAELIDRAESSGKNLAYEVASDKFTAHTSITFFATTHPKLLSMIAGSCATSGANIVDAQITTTQDGRAVDTICISREFDHLEDEKRRAETIAQSLEKLLRGELHLDNLKPSNRMLKGPISAFNVAPDVTIDNSLSDDLTVIEVRGLDRAGLLFDLTQTIGELNLDISSAHIATYGEKAVDVFYVTDLLGDKIKRETRQEQIRTTIEAVLMDEETDTSLYG
ncbi:MAG: bifunctional uridylyltransferase/uridylyl-removing enzyme [Rhodomicrobium sp.]|nr:MAG: bifunctional uridylyltransferase/uridylyl-removing enzyme [Rhodomicrobium sp.]